ncbi:MAG: glycerol-3-phosphate 1-O-acyltransferase PlsY [Proteobacteria bacterium]|nr:glycerol-3-phosphate 1-O-acyltransferase PlsY [Pseudomonadota bacterium]
MLELGAKFLISYFIGSLMGSMIVGRLKGGVDIRSMGSGNAGFTNALRTQGIAFAVAVVIIDIGKGVIGAGVVPELNLPFIATDPTISRTWLTLSCATAAVMGHVWPMYHHFRGGKGAATLAGTLIILSLNLVAPLLLLWVVVLVLSGYVGLATMTAAVALPVWLAVTQLPAEQPLFIYSTAMAAFIIYCHHANIQRMRDGSEHRNTQLMLFRRRGIVSDDEQD